MAIFTALFTNATFLSVFITPALIGIIAILLWLFSVLFDKPIKLNLGILNLDFPGKKKQNTVSENKVKQANQTLLISKLQSFITEKQKQIFRIQNNTIERQMNFFDEKIVEIRSMYTEEFVKLLRKKCDAHIDVRNHQEFRNYKMMIDLMLEDIKAKTFKKSIKQNHLADITMELWESFVEQKVSVTQAMIKEYFDNNYPDDMNVERFELDEANERVFDRCRSLFTLSYRRAREIAIETRAKVHYIEDEIEREVRDENIHLTKIESEET